MWQPQSKQILFLILVTNFKTIQCECQHLHVVMCDSLEEAYKLKVDRSMTDFVIKSKTPKLQEQMSRFDGGKFFNAFRWAKSVTIIGQIDNRVEVFLNPDDKFVMNYIAFYGNYIKKLDSLYIPYPLHLRRLSLVNNHIETIDDAALYKTNIEEIDLSDNLLESIECQCFEDGVKMFIAKNNKLSFIKSGSLPRGLEFLSLDNNQLVTIEVDVLNQLDELQELHISKNKLKVFPKLSKLHKLKILDLSYNFIENLENDTFKDTVQLKYLDLSHNRIYSIDFLIFSPPYTEVRLQFNRLRRVAYTLYNSGVNRTSLVNLWLNPNPWWCADWITFRKFLDQHNVQLSNCDTAYFGSGLPYCLDYHSVDDDEYDTQEFFKVIQSKKELLECNFQVKK